MKKIRKTAVYIAALTVILAALLFVLPVNMNAAETTVGPFIVEGGTNGTDYKYEYENRVLTILTTTPITIKNTYPNVATKDRILVKMGVDANITLAGVNIHVWDKQESAFYIEGTDEEGSTGNVTITLQDGTKNILKGGTAWAGITIWGGTIFEREEPLQNCGTLTIQGDGTLEAIGGAEGGRHWR